MHSSQEYDAAKRLASDGDKFASQQYEELRRGKLFYTVKEVVVTGLCSHQTLWRLTRAGMLVLGVLGDTDLVFVEGDEVCVGLVTPLPSQLIDVTKEDVEESVEVMGETLPDIYAVAAVAAHAVTGAESVRCDALTFCMEPSQRLMRVCHVRGVCRM